MTVKQFKTLLKNQLTELNASLSQYLEKNPSLTYPAAYFCSDAFSTENIDETAKYMLKHIKENANGNFYFDTSQLFFIIEKHGLELNNTERIRKFKENMLSHLQDPDPETREKALYSLRKIRANDPNVSLTILQVALRDTDSNVRNSAIIALDPIKPVDSKILSEISQTLRNTDKNVRSMALQALSKNYPTDPKIHSDISLALRNTDKNVRLMALEALSRFKPTDPKIHLEILQSALHDLNNKNRIITLESLRKIKSSHPEVGKGLLQIAIHHNTDLKERILAIQALEGMDLSNRSVQKILQKEVLENSSDLSQRPDLSSLIEKIMSSSSPQTSKNEAFCQSSKNILSQNLTSLINFFSNHSVAFGISRCFSETMNENEDFSTITPPPTQAHGDLSATTQVVS